MGFFEGAGSKTANCPCLTGRGELGLASLIFTYSIRPEYTITAEAKTHRVHHLGKGGMLCVITISTISIGFVTSAWTRTTFLTSETCLTMTTPAGASADVSAGVYADVSSVAADAAGKRSECVIEPPPEGSLRGR